MGSPPPNYTAGRISESAFVSSTSVLFAVGLLAVCGRFFIRFRLQRSLGIHDAVLIFGAGVLICAEAMLFTFKDDMYLVEAYLLRSNQIITPSDLAIRSFAYHKWVTVALVLLWIAVVSVKFSFLFLFRNFIGRLPALHIFWWFAAGYNLAIFGYGISSYIAPCPYFYDAQSATCGHGENTRLFLKYAIALVVLDVAGDLLVLAIPIYLFWNVRIHRTQRLSFILSLGLAFVVVVFKMLRPAAMSAARDTADVTWSTYWQYITAEISVIFAALAACRTLFLRHVDNARMKWPSPRSLCSYRQRAGSDKRALTWTLPTSSTWRSGSESSTATNSTARLDPSDSATIAAPKLTHPQPACGRKGRPSALSHGFEFGFDRLIHGFPVPNTPRMTGIRTLIAGPGSRSRPASHAAPDAARASGTFAEEGGNHEFSVWRYPSDGVIKVEQGIDSYSIHVRGSQDLTGDVPEALENMPELPGSATPERNGKSRPSIDRTRDSQDDIEQGRIDEETEDPEGSDHDGVDKEGTGNESERQDGGRQEDDSLVSTGHQQEAQDDPETRGQV